MAKAKVLTQHTVTITAHHMPPRFDIPARTFKLYSRTRTEAIEDAVRLVAEEVGCDGWKPWLRAIAKHAKVVSKRETVYV